jgi:hypothetical protein
MQNFVIKDLPNESEGTDFPAGFPSKLIRRIHKAIGLNLITALLRSEGVDRFSRHEIH